MGLSHAKYSPNCTIHHLLLIQSLWGNKVSFMHNITIKEAPETGQ